MTHHHRGKPPDFSETKAHIFVAGHELLRAAEGVLKYCRYYVESSSEKAKHPNLMKIFSDGIKIAKDLGTSIAKEITIQGAAKKVMRHFCDTVEKEIRHEKKQRSHGKATRKRKRK